MNRKPKTQKEKILQAVEQIKDGEHIIFRCAVDIDNARKCVYAQKQFVAGNFKRHFESNHPHVLKELALDECIEEEPAQKKQKKEHVQKKQKPKVSKLLVDMEKRNALLGLLQMVTVNNLPYNFIDWAGSKTLIHPILKACGFQMTRHRIAKFVQTAAATIREILRAEFQKQIMSIKIDSASRRGRSVFGINAQYADSDGNVKIRHLAVHEMNERQTKENLAAVILQELSEFDLRMEQIFAFAHDNGANMCASIRFLKSLLKPASEEDVPLSTMLPAEFNMLDENDREDLLACEEPIEEDEIEIATATEENEDSDDFENGQDGTADILVNDDNNEELEILNSIRCGAHTAQLVAYDVIKQYKPRLAQINKICLAMHHKTNRELFVLHKIALPPKVNETRWGVWFILLRYLQVLRTKPFLTTLQNQDQSLDLNKHWQFIDRFCEAFEPIYILTLKLQKDHVPLSEFYANWLICQAELYVVKKKGNTLAAKLLTSMEERIQKLSTSMAFKACLYMDPRFNFAGSGRLSPSDKKDVQEYLIALNNRLDDMEGSREEQSTDSEPANNSGFVEDYLMNFFNEGSQDALASSSTKSSSNESLLFDLMKLENREKVNITIDHPVQPSGSSKNSGPQPTCATTTTQPCTSTTQPSKSATQPPQSDASISSSSRFDILQYWKKRRYSNPRVYRLAMVVLSAPSTQVTVERLFSQVKYILTDSRMRLSDVSIKDIMVLKMNADLLEEVVDTMLERDAI